MPVPDEVRAKIRSCVRSAIMASVPSTFTDPDRQLSWDLRTDKVFLYDVRLVLQALAKMCAAFELEFDPNMLPQQGVFKTFPRLANLCAYLEYRLEQPVH